MNTAHGSDVTRPLDWLVSNFANDVPGVSHAVLVSADGTPTLFDRESVSQWRRDGV